MADDLRSPEAKALESLDEWIRIEIVGWERLAECLTEPKAARAAIAALAVVRGEICRRTTGAF